MGMRIHKKLGYGLTDLKGPNDYRLTENWKDTRTKIENGAKNFLKDLQCYNDISRNDGALVHLYNTTKKKKYQMPKVFDVESVMDYEEEFGLKRVLLFQPIYFLKDWTQYDHDVSYYEEKDRNSTLTPNVRKLKVINLYPFYKWAKFKHDGEEHINYDEPIPTLPDFIELYCKYFNVFKNIQTLNELKPIIYTYWA